MSNKPLRIGVYIIPPVQFLDVSPIDLFACVSKEYLVDTPLPGSVISQGIDVRIKYISPEGPGKEGVVPLTASAGLRVDHGIDDEEVRPGNLDVIFIPGPPPDKTFTDKQLDFVRKHWNNGNGATIMSVCTGALIVAASGIAAKRQVTAPRMLLPNLRKQHPETTWVDKRWCKDPSGKLWSSGGVTNGQDMVAAYLRDIYPGAFVEVVMAMADVGDRGQEYGEGPTMNNLWWAFTLLKTWLFRSKRANSKRKSN